MDCSPPGSSVHGDFPGKNTGVGCHFFLQGIFLTQELNPGLLNYKQILYQLSYEGSQQGLVLVLFFERILKYIRNRLDQKIVTEERGESKGNILN